jgi:hypothetical protein
MSPQSESILKSKPLISITKKLNFKFGIQQDKNASEILLKHIIKERQELSSHILLITLRRLETLDLGSSKSNQILVNTLAKF